MMILQHHSQLLLFPLSRTLFDLFINPKPVRSAKPGNPNPIKTIEQLAVNVGEDFGFENNRGG